MPRIVGALGPVLYVGGRQVTRLPWASVFQLPVPVRGAFPSRLMAFAFLILAVMVALWLATLQPALAHEAGALGASGAGDRRGRRERAVCLRQRFRHARIYRHRPDTACI